MADGTTDTQAVQKSTAMLDQGFDNLSIQQILKLMILEKAHEVRKSMVEQAKELRERQVRIHFLHTLSQKLTQAIKDGAIDFGEEYEQVLAAEQAKTQEEKDEENKNPSDLTALQLLIRAKNDFGYDLQLEKEYDKEYVPKLLDSVRTICDDLNMQNNLQSQDLSQLVNERYEIFQLARSMTKVIDELMKRMAQGMARG